MAEDFGDSTGSGLVSTAKQAAKEVVQAVVTKGAGIGGKGGGGISSPGSQGHDGSFQTACRRICRTFPRASGRKARPLPLDRTPESQQTVQPETQKG